MNAGFVLNSVLLGVGLAMDAFSVSIANALNDPGMKMRRQLLIAGTFAFFQFLMPMAGWICVHTILSYFVVFQRFIPWIALILLGWIGGKMLWEGFHPEDGAAGEKPLSRGTLLLQGVATSIDALSAGFTLASYEWPAALAASLIIAAVTHLICMGGLRIGRRFGERLSQKAGILGGVILIGIGLEIFIKSFL